MKILKYFFIFLFFIYSAIAFLPKANIYYEIEQVVAKQNIFINHEKIIPGLFSLNIKDADVVYEDVNLGKINSVYFKFFIFKNYLKFKNINLATNNFKLIPKNIEVLKFSYAITSPRKIMIYSKNDMGMMDGYFDIVNQSIHIRLQINKLAKLKYKTILRNFKIKRKGIYIYEKNIKIY
jgi:hypothetical protein